MKIIPESKMNFGKFDEYNLFYIESSELYKSIGSGIKTVEFILKYKENCIIFLEAKESCPNAANRDESREKELKFEKYYGDITEKFVDSLQIYLAAILGKYEDILEMGAGLNVDSLHAVQLKFILVVKNADITWLAGPMAEIKARLRKWIKIWGIDVIVLNEDLAAQYHLTCQA